MSQQEVQLTDLQPQQLQEVKRQLDEEIEHLTTSFTSLKQAQSKYRGCLSDVETLTPEAQDKQILVPLTSSLYVPGRIRDPEHVVVDVGTGYYIKKTRSQAQTFYTSKISFVQANLDKLQETIERKQQNQMSVRDVLEAKMQEATRAAAQGAGGKK